MSFFKAIIAGATITLLVFFNACSGADFSSEAPNSNNNSPNSGPSSYNDDGLALPATDVVDKIIQSCQQAKKDGALISKDHPVFFDDPINEVTTTDVCAWNEQGNLSPVNGVTSARYRQNHKIQIPNNAIVCDVDFDFQTQAMKFDDNFFFLMNGWILSTDASDKLDLLDSQKLKLKNNSLKVFSYNWSEIAGIKTDRSSPQPNAYDYCLGEQESLGLCSWPQTETSGQMSLDFASELMLVVAHNRQGNTINLDFITTGDDNLSTDCRHEPIDMTLKVKYFIPK